MSEDEPLAPTKSELDRRITSLETQMREGFAGINSRLDALPNQQTILALFQVRDSQITSLDAKVSGLEHARERERAERIEADSQIEKRALEAKRWAVGVAISGVGAVVTVLAFLTNFLGG